MNECNDPDHGAINAERAESRGLRKAWIAADNKSQYLERQLAAVTAQRDRLAEALGEIARDEDIPMSLRSCSPAYRAKQALQSLTSNDELCQPCPPSTPPRQETAPGQGLA